MREIKDFTKLKVGELVIEKHKTDKAGKNIYLSKVLRFVDDKKYKCQYYTLIANGLERCRDGTTDKHFSVFRLNKKELEKYNDMLIFKELKK